MSGPVDPPAVTTPDDETSALGVLFWAPLGTDPDDSDAWQEIGTVDDVAFELPDEEPALAEWSAPLLPRTFTMPIQGGGLTWWGHLVLFHRSHPAARRAKTEYHRRRR
ncbi:hypothetical protein ABT352_32930 [Streptosporangium sp. NPDC000563]|uniref:hypothetical protein n=1 Tax=Streptosporangium sp. NPDC000563 TaxID=3154366 RepID=UPI00332E7371